MKFIATRLEVLVSVIYIMLFQGVFWPPNSYFWNQTLPLDASDPFSFWGSTGMLIFVLVAGFFRREQMLRLLRPGWPILALLALAYLSAFWSDAPFLVLRRSTTLAGTTMFGFYLVARFDIDRLVGILVKVSACAAVASISAYFVFGERALQRSMDYPTAWRGAYTDKNTLGLWAAIGILAACYALWKGYAPRVVALAVIPVNFLLLYLSKSGTPLVMLAACAAVLPVLLAFRQRNGFGFALGFAMLITGALLIGVAAAEWTEVLGVLNRNPTLTGRSRIWAVVLQQIEKRPWLGYGYGGFWRHDGPEAVAIWEYIMKWRVPHAHNGFYEVALSLGLVGLASVILVWLDAIYRGLRVLAVAQAKHAVFFLVLLVAILVENQTEYEFLRSNAFLWVLFVYVFVQLGRYVLAAREERALRPARHELMPVPVLAYPRAVVRPGQ